MARNQPDGRFAVVAGIIPNTTLRRVGRCKQFAACTRAANKRTLLAYLRTSLMLLVAGATAVKLVDMNRSILITGWIFLIVGVIVGVVGVWRFLVMRAAINERER